jgi:Raf kinase inhibitor-like YbhB/YbcL family protein
LLFAIPERASGELRQNESATAPAPMNCNFLTVGRLSGFCVATAILIAAAAAETLQVQVGGLRSNEVIPQKYVYNHSGCSGGNVSPDVRWSGAPASAKSFALVMWDQDAPVSGGFYHWVILNLPRTTKRLAEGTGNVSRRQTPPSAVQLVNDWGEPGYGGPCPPEGRQHRYHFIVYALGVDQLPITEKTKISEAAAQIRKNALASGEVVLVYGH